MNRPRNRSLFLCAAAALSTAALRAQDDSSESPLLAIAQGFSIDPATVVPGSDSATLLFTPSDFSTTPPAPLLPTPGLPDFTTVLDGLALDMDAFSVGLDYIQSTPTGVALVPPGNWAAVTFSVTRATAGAAGGRIAGEVASGTAEGDVFVYVLPGSALPPQLVDRTMRNQDSSEMNIDSPGAPGDIDAHDIYVSLIFEENPQLVPLLPFISVFFSIKTASLAAVPAAWWGGTPVSGATVFRRDWLGASWSTPAPFLIPSDLGLLPAEDVDAVAVDLFRGRVLFSTTRPPSPAVPLRNPILYHALGSPGNVVYVTSTGVPVSDRIGVVTVGGIDDVDGICALDPGPGAVINFDRIIGTPQQSLIPTLPSQLASAVFRRRAPGGGQLEFVTYAAGWPQPGVPSQGVAALLIAPVSPFGPHTLFYGAARPNPLSPYSSFAGHPERAVIQIPNNPLLLGADIYFQWVVFEAALIDVALPIGIKI